MRAPILSIAVSLAMLVPLACGGGGDAEDASAGAGGAGDAGTGGAAGAGGKAGASGQGGSAGGASGKGGGGSGGASGAAGNAGTGGTGAAAGAGGAAGTSGAAGKGGATTGGSGGGGGAAGAAGAGGASCNPACSGAKVCLGGVCVDPMPACKTNAECKDDTYCDPSGKCVAYGVPNKTFDSDCKVLAPPGVLQPGIKCEFSKPPANDPFPNHVFVSPTPMVADFGASDDKAPHPSIVVPFRPTVLPPGAVCPLEDCNYRYGVIRVLSGRDCTLQANIGGEDFDEPPNGKKEWARSASPVALADLDGDKKPEIIAFMVEEHQGEEVLMAFKQVGTTWKPFWPKKKAQNGMGATLSFTLRVNGPTGNDWGAPSIVDVDDDGKPDIVREGIVVDGVTGVLKASIPPGYQSYGTGQQPVLANLDGDPNLEFTNGAAMWEFVPGTGWQVDPAYPSMSPATGAWIALADFTPYDGLKKPEIVSVASGVVTISDLAHQTFFTASVPGGGGGPPTVADFDGDGLPEVGVAGGDFYAVFDPDCGPTPRPGGKCVSRDQCDFAPGGACPDKILWARKSQDHSSAQTGSSVFDFEADGAAEVVYADECFTRVYSGRDGRVLFSQYRSSATWQEYPVVVDVDGDYRAEIVVPNDSAGFTAATCGELLNADGVETYFAGLICNTHADCLSGTCDAGLCRCVTSAQCCPDKDDAKCIESGYKCAPAPAGSKGMGKTCRASYPHGLQGIRVYEDSRDRWVRSRTIWNQHAYSVTHINEDGSVPKTSLMKKNWLEPGLNNFRQNVPGDPNASATPDFTAQAGSAFTCGPTGVTLKSQVCNRGSAPVGVGLVVGFYQGTMKVCTTTLNQPIFVGECVEASCLWSTPPKTMPVDIKVVPNDGGGKTECLVENDEGVVVGVICK